MADACRAGSLKWTNFSEKVDSQSIKKINIQISNKMHCLGKQNYTTLPHFKKILKPYALTRNARTPYRTPQPQSHSSNVRNNSSHFSLKSSFPMKTLETSNSLPCQPKAGINRSRQLKTILWLLSRNRISTIASFMNPRMSQLPLSRLSTCPKGILHFLSLSQSNFSGPPGGNRGGSGGGGNWGNGGGKGGRGEGSGSLKPVQSTVADVEEGEGRKGTIVLDVGVFSPLHLTLRSSFSLNFPQLSTNLPQFPLILPQFCPNFLRECRVGAVLQLWRIFWNLKYSPQFPLIFSQFSPNFPQIFPKFAPKFLSIFSQFPSQYFHKFSQLFF